ncbi:MAG: hypothetical protein M3R52_04110 [Acidobacteriota bacterium]|nr:hypothetical protein [Acidobacteriota bacterium]
MNKLLESLFRRSDAVRARRAVDGLWAVACVGFLILLGGQMTSLFAQAAMQQGTPQQAVATQRKLPSAEKVVDNYLKAVGGKKRVATIRDATYEWTIQLKDQPLGIAKTLSRTPASVRTEMIFGNGQLTSGANARSAWKRGLGGELQTLTDAEAAAARLQAVLDAGHLVDSKKSNVLARVVSVKNVGTDPAYVVEFSLRSGARLRYLFSTTTKLLLSIEDDARLTTTRFEDYRTEGNLLEPHRVSINSAGQGELTFILQRASYNAGLADSVFDPPRAAEVLDVVSLLREVSRNQDELEKRFTEYSFVQKETSREISSKGEVKKEITKVFEVFPIANREPVMKLISENGVTLSGERAAKEQKRVEEEFAKAERDKDKDEQRVKKYRAERERKKAARAKEDEDDDVEVSQFLKVHEFVSPRRERFRDREAVVFDFRVRPGFKSSNRQENLISKLVGVVWIDPADKQVMRLEARLAEGFKMAGGLLVNLRPGAAFVMEQTRVAEGLWLPRMAQINLSVKVLLFGGGDYNQTFEWSDYKHFSGDVGDYKLDAPKTNAAPEKKP